jgi:hypothetical protein
VSPANFSIKTPRGSVVTTPDGSFKLTWNPTFADVWNAKFNKAQAMFDYEVLRQCEPYTPLLTGTLIATGILGTVPGSGVVQWIAPYARRQYYSKRKPGSATGPLRGPYWFERLKADGLEYLVLFARQQIKRQGRAR